MKKCYTEKEIRLLSQSAIGKTFGELQKMNVKTVTDSDGNKSAEAFNKAFFGHLFETDVFGVDINSFSRPDFEEAGIELKVTPYKKNKDNTLSAKERLVLNIIDYMTEYKNTFENSHFMSKNKKLQIIWYLWEKGKKKEDLKITNELLYSFPNEDMPIIKKDWEFIVKKIKDGKAHEISEADTMYLGACTKGASSETRRNQPFSNIKAMQRAFCFKTSYMTGLVRKYIGNYSDVEKILKGTEKDFASCIQNVVEKYKGKTQSQLMNELSIDTKAKNVFNIIINRMFNVKSKLKETDEFVKANIIPKTIRVEENGNIIESMSFPHFKFDEVMNTDFEDSYLKEELETTKYMFFVFKKENGEYVFKGIKLWNMPELTIENKVKSVYEKTQKVIRSGAIVNHIDDRGRRITNFPGMSDNGICHVRPHGRDSLDTLPLPVPDKVTGMKEFTKQCFWFNNSYIKEIISDIL